MSIEEYINYLKENDVSHNRLLVPIGKTDNEILTKDWISISHSLIAGPTGCGKTCFIQSTLALLVGMYNPSKLKLLIYDSKGVDYNEFTGLPHLMAPVITNMDKCKKALQFLSYEVDNRCEKIIKANVRNINQYNKLSETLPYIIVVLDRLESLNIKQNDPTYDSLETIARKGKAAGIFVTFLSSYPSSDFFNASIKNNISSQIAFRTASKHDSKVILNEIGAESLTSPGEIIFKDSFEKRKLLCTYFSQKELDKFLKKIKNSQVEQYDKRLINTLYNESRYSEKEYQLNRLLPDAIKVVTEANYANTTLIQRKLKVGYAMAAMLIDKLEEMGIVGPFTGSRPREVFLSSKDYSTAYNTSYHSSITCNDTIDTLSTDCIKINCCSSVIKVNDRKISIDNPAIIHGITCKNNTQYTINFDINMIQQLKYKKARIFRNGCIIFVISTKESKVSIGVEFGKNTPEISNLLSHISNNAQLEIQFE